MPHAPVDPEFAPWHVSSNDFPGNGAAPAEKLKFLVRYAVLAPSGHNTQPWTFRIREDKLSLYADRTRALPVVDHDDRELTISCGAALYNLRVAAGHFGHEPACELLPDPDLPDLLARFALGARRGATIGEFKVFASIVRRHTNRMPFEEKPVEKTAIARGEAAVRAEGAWVRFITDKRARHAVAKLIGEADRLQFADKRFRRELAAWIHSNRSHSRDGMPGYSHGFGGLMSLAPPFFIRTFDMGKSTAAHDQDLADHSPLLAVIGTPDDDPRAWLRAGQAMQGLLLIATAENVSASFLNQPIEVQPLRARLAKLLEVSGHPQVLLRVGYGPPVKPTPRRAVEEVIRTS